jgi:mono/diheme cytochrome c family protein
MEEETMHIELKSLIAHKQLPVFRFNAATKKLFGFIGSWVFLIALVVVPAWAQDGQALFQEKCSACHSIGGGDVLGPDLKGVTAKRDHEWLEHWIREPEEMINQGDPLATQLLKQYNDMPMPSAGLSPAEVNAVLAYIEAQSGSGATPPSGAVAEPVPLGNPSVGQALFTGAVRLQPGSGRSAAATWGRT